MSDKMAADLADFKAAGYELDEYDCTKTVAHAELWIRTPGQDAELAFEGTLTSVSVDMGVDGEHNYRREL